MKKIAIVLANLGGPDSLSAVEKFLFNLFYDRNIINIPNPFRWILAKIISSLRANKTKEIYRAIGNKSPLLEETNEQAEALEKYLNSKQKKIEFKVFVAMRYWHPLSKETVDKIKDFGAEEVFFIPLYPQFSTTTTKSSLQELKKYLGNIPIKSICCYYSENDFIKAHVNKLVALYNQITDRHKKIRILFSAHGLPKSVIAKGDPYQWQIEQVVKLVVKELKGLDFEYQVCYQSKVGPMEWLEPTTESELIKAAKDEVAVIVVPVAFVSEHSETLFELDIMYKKLADELGIKGYYRVETLGKDKLFIATLANLSSMLMTLVKNSKKDMIISNVGSRQCPREFCSCLNNYKEDVI
jgi:ferrochelatase